MYINILYIRVFKKSSPNGKVLHESDTVPAMPCCQQVTVYLGKRDFVDHVTEQEPIGNGRYYSSNNYFCSPSDGVVLVDPEYFQKEGKQDRKGDK